MKNQLITLLFLVSALVISCNYKVINPPTPSPNPQGNNGDGNDDDNGSGNANPDNPGGGNGSGSSSGGGDPGGGGNNDKLFYAQSVAPILGNSCTACHGSFGGVNLESYEQTMNTVVVGDSAHSPLCTVLLDKKMPPGNPLSDTDTEIICQWIDDGALQ